jgi:hypothetical protein
MLNQIGNKLVCGTVSLGHQDTWLGQFATNFANVKDPLIMNGQDNNELKMW